MGCGSPNRSFCTDLEARGRKVLPVGLGSLTRPRRVKGNLKPQVFSNCEVTQTAGRERTWCFELCVFLIHGKVRNLLKPLLCKQNLMRSPCGSVILKNVPKDTSLSSSKLRKWWDQSHSLRRRVLLNSFMFAPLSWEEWNRQTRLQKHLLKSISPRRVHGWSSGIPRRKGRVRGRCVWLCVYVSSWTSFLEVLKIFEKISLIIQNDQV